MIQKYNFIWFKKWIPVTGLTLILLVRVILASNETPAFPRQLNPFKSIQLDNNAADTFLSSSPRIKNIYNDIYFLNDNEGWIVGSEGQILHTIDNGETWTAQPSHTTTNLLTLAILDPKHGWIGGENGTILHWDGADWTIQYQDKNLRIFDIYFSNLQDGTAIAGKYILKTTNGGETWHLQPTPDNQTFVGAYFFTNNDGWAFGGTEQDMPLLMRWSGDSRIAKTPAIANKLLLDMDFTNANTGWMVGFGNSVLHTKDAGKSWEQQQVKTEHGLIYKIDFTDSLNGWLVTQSGEIFQTKDGGRHWNLNHRHDARLLGIHFSSAKKGWIVGSRNTILQTRNGGQTWRAQEIGKALIMSHYQGAYCIIARETVQRPSLVMHVPVISSHTSPIAFELRDDLSSGKIKSFRTIEKHADNWVVEVTFHKLVAGDSVNIPWDCWVVKNHHDYADLPDSIDISARTMIPDSVKKYLAASKICQSTHPQILNQAKRLVGDSRNLGSVVNKLVNYAGNTIEYRSGWEQDALSTLHNGYGLCNGKANLTIAMLRALGIPARTLMVAKTHFITEYYLPTYGWVRAETTSGAAIQAADRNTVMWVASPEDEDASPYSSIVCYWGTGDSRLLYDILYNQTEINEYAAAIDTEPEQAALLLNQVKGLWRFYNHYVNMNLSQSKKSLFDQAKAHQFQAVQFFKDNNIESFSRQIELARAAYLRIEKETLLVARHEASIVAPLFELNQNYPNPFNNQTLIRFSLYEAGSAAIRIFNVAGQEVKVLLDEFKPAGNYNASWNATNKFGQPVASGVYFFQLEFQGFIQKKEAILLK